MYKHINSDLPAADSPLTSGWALPLTAVIFIASLHANSYGGDISYWSSWMTDLLRGYDTINANYPPMLLHWFWLLAQIFDTLGFEYPPKSEVTLKFFALLPILFIQLWLSQRVEQQLIARHIEPLKSPVFWGVVASPALLLDGPVWGQVDLLPFLPLWLSLSYAFHGRFFAAGAAFALALLCKFQAIILLPVLAGLFMRQLTFKTWYHVPQVVSGIALTTLIGFLPFILSGRFTEMFHAAYLGNTSMYPLATMNAANFWYAIAGNMTDMHKPILGSDISLLTPHKIGLFLFISASILVMLRAWFKTERFGQVIGLSLTILLAFFVFAPSMHERYLFLLVPFAAMGCARGDLKGGWLAIATLLVTLNILLVLPLAGESVWIQLSWLHIAAACVALMTLALGFDVKVKSLAHYSRPVTAIAITAFAGFQISQLESLKKIDFDEQGKIYLSDIREESYTQGWGRLHRDRNISNNTLAIASQRFDKGLGVHAPSKIVYTIPTGARYFHSYYGLDQIALKGRVRFDVLFDDKLAWSSAPVIHTRAKEIWLEVGAAKTITLVVDPLGSNGSDHANWAGTSFWKEMPNNTASLVQVGI